MTAFIKPNCRIRPMLEKYKDVILLTVLPTGYGPMIDLKGTLIPLPAPVTTIPSLLDGQDLYVGEGAIIQYLQKLYPGVN